MNLTQRGPHPSLQECPLEPNNPAKDKVDGAVAGLAPSCQATPSRHEEEAGNQALWCQVVSRHRCACPQGPQPHPASLHSHSSSFPFRPGLSCHAGHDPNTLQLPTWPGVVTLAPPWLGRGTDGPPACRLQLLEDSTCPAAWPRATPSLLSSDCPAVRVTASSFRGSSSTRCHRQG